mmetsp:Transcript_40293/g.96620  ORF Transcript_40293/g.96620 Transcript_40293/m.96620 type:complete len:214 (+) Transcript_40293:2350-2991(+)
MSILCTAPPFVSRYTKNRPTTRKLPGSLGAAASNTVLSEVFPSAASSFRTVVVFLSVATTKAVRPSSPRAPAWNRLLWSPRTELASTCQTGAPLRLERRSTVFEVTTKTSAPEGMNAALCTALYASICHCRLPLAAFHAYKAPFSDKDKRADLLTTSPLTGLLPGVVLLHSTPPSFSATAATAPIVLETYARLEDPSAHRTAVGSPSPLNSQS